MILVTGASGLLGSNVLLMGTHAGREMGATAHRHRVVRDGVPTFEIDLTHDEAVQALVREAGPRAIIHCAAQTNIDWAEQHPTETNDLNVRASGTLARAAAAAGAAFVYVSTDAVFDGTQSRHRESDPPNPVNHYGRTKLDGERATTDANPDTLIVRTNIYGWNAQPKESLAEWVLARLERGTTVPGLADVFFSPMLVNDFAEILFTMLDRGMRGLYHVAGSDRISKYDFALDIARVFGLNNALVAQASVRDAALSASRAVDISLSTDRVAKALGRRMPSVDEGLRRFAKLRDDGFRAELKAMMAQA